MSMREYGVVEAQNLAMGQAGSIFVTGTTAVTCGAGSGVFVAIQFIEDTTFTTLTPCTAPVNATTTGIPNCSRRAMKSIIQVF